MLVMAQQKLLLLRIDAGFETQQELAEAAGVNVATISFAETGYRIVSPKTRRKIVNALKRRGLKVEIEDIDWGPAK